jgi:chemotaxis protein methyltransferase CheR
MKPTGFREQFTNIADACALAQAIVDTVGEAVLVLDKELRVIAASRSFYSTFKVTPEDTQGSLLYALGDGQWDIPELRVLLEKIIPEQGDIKGHEVEHEFPGLGQRTMRLNARQVFYEGGSHATILLSIEDVTDRRILEREKDVLLREKDQLLKEKDVLFEELQHRISNSLQVIASIILLRARTVQSEESRLHLQDTHKRVMSVAAVQEQLHVLGTIGSIEIAPYLSKLCDALATSMIGDSRPITLKVVGAEGTATSRQAESIGLSRRTRGMLSSMRFPKRNSSVKSTLRMIGPEPTGSLRSPTTGLVDTTAPSLKKRSDWAPASSRRFHIS